jgi:integrative and conjugative element protein (TIGR02256 family)
MPTVTAWISFDILRSLVSEADKRYPLETGGVLIGYWAEAADVVVTASVGPGPASVHNRFSYQHDHDWEASKIAERYEQSGRSEIYIGDWHTHPDASRGDLSFMDRRSIRRVIKSPDARVARPLMSVLFGEPGHWQFTTWVGELRPRWGLLPRLLVHPVEVQEFG